MAAEVFPVTPDEAMLILGSLDIDEIEQLIEEIKILRKNRLLDEAIVSATEHKPIKTPPIASI